MKKIDFKSNNFRIVVFAAIILIVGSIVFKDNIIDVLNIGNRRLPIYCVDTGEEKLVSITFDASWGADNTIKILDILDEYDVKATFFLVGRWVDEYQNEVREIHKRGHELGNHSNSHPNMVTLDKNQIIREILLTESKIRKLTGEGTAMFRCPEGAYNDNVIATIEEAKHYPIQWDVDSIDWKEQGAEVEYKRVVSKTVNGSIILFHNNAKYTPENLPKVIEALKSKGYKFVTVGQLIYKEDYSIDHTGKQSKK